MNPLVQDSKYPNIYYTRDVSEEFQNSVRYIYPEFKNEDIFDIRNTIIITPSKTNVYLDTLGIIYESTRVLSYNINYTNYLAAYAMFSNILLGLKIPRDTVTTGTFGFDYPFMIYKALETIPDEYINTFNEIPGFEPIGNVKITKAQLKCFRDVSKRINRINITTKKDRLEKVIRNSRDFVHELIPKFPAPKLKEYNSRFNIKYTVAAINWMTNCELTKEIVEKTLNLTYFSMLLEGTTFFDSNGKKLVNEFEFTQRYIKSMHSAELNFVVFIKSNQFELDVIFPEKPTKLRRVAKIIF